MLVCNKCGFQNREGTLFCEDCGRSLADGGAVTIPTRRIGDDPDEAAARATWGSARISTEMTIVMHIRDSEQPLTFTPTRRLVFGRADTTSPIQPDIDLTPFGALERGVSRQHAIIEFNEDTLMLLDAGSANGTYLNGQRLLPNQPRVLRDGDEVRLGKLVAHVYFK
jgi:pSer/pThr/pTyr-binding forkhead associated (FHA) protein